MPVYDLTEYGDIQQKACRTYDNTIDMNQLQIMLAVLLAFHANSNDSVVFDLTGKVTS